MKTHATPTPQQVTARRADVRARWTDADAERRRETAKRRQAELLAQLLALESDD